MAIRARGVVAGRAQTSRARLWGVALAGGWALCFGCQTSRDRPPLADFSGDGTPEDGVLDPRGGRTGLDAGPDAGPDAATGADAGPNEATETDAGPNEAAEADGGPALVANCGEESCRGHGSCIESDVGPICACDEGYLAEGEPGDIDCVVDRSCKRIRYLEDDSCRYLLNSIPAVAMFFAVDYCAGTAVLPEDLGDLSEAFDVFENGVNILTNEESVATVIERDVESYVTIALDVSKSVTGVEGDAEKAALLTRLVSNLREFVRRLGQSAAAGAPPVSVSVNVFGRFVAEYVGYTTDLNQVDAALLELEQDPLSVVQLVGGDGTALYEAVSESIHAVERVRSLRSLVTDTGVLTSGTVVIVSDGRESTGAQLDTTLVNSTKVNVISIGISDDIRDEDLTSIGRDGSFLAPLPEDWEAAFDEIAVRVEQYPDRAYLLAYCSSATTGKPTVSVGLRGEQVAEAASCAFDAALFSVDPNAVCDLAFFENHCDDPSLECGSFLACGGCSSGECCADGTCSEPTAIQNGRLGLVDCHDDAQLCLAEDQVCVRYEGDEDPPISSTCQAPVDQGEACSSSLPVGRCTAGTDYCDSSDGIESCAPVTLHNGDVCGTSAKHPREVCPELNCARTNPDSAIDPFVCQPAARVFDRCGGTSADAACEPGAFCAGTGLCQARSLRGCSSDGECLTGYCNTDIRRCEEVGACYWNWSSVVSQP